MERKFKQPDKEYTPYPFWFWNDELDEDEIRRQINEMSHKDVNGFVLHPRIGIPKNIPYLGEKFFYYVRIAIEEADKLNMTVILYDEGMYPSGSANGQVVEKYPEYASKGIYSIKEDKFKQESNGFQKIIFKYSLKDGQIMEYDEAHSKNDLYYLVHEDSKGTIRGIHYGEDDGEELAPASVDLLNRNAITYFIHLTHDRYYEELKEYFGKTIVGFFTDEPDILGRNAQKDMLPFNEELYQELKKEGFTIEDIALATLKDKKSSIRQSYNKKVTHLLSQNYYEPISSWCKNHGIFLTGHPHGSDDLGLQEHFQVPGQDTVWRWVAPENDLNIKGSHSTLAKCSSDAARHMGIDRNSNEVFGCCGKDGVQWSFSPQDMKWYLNWLFIRGVNMIIPHAFFYSIKGKRRDERAPDVGMHNLWWDKYRFFSTFIKRCGYMFSDSVNQTNIAVLAEADFMPHKGLDQLYQNQIEFNYLLDDYLYESQAKIDGSQIKIEKQKYDTLLVSTSYLKINKLKKALQVFEKSGGMVIAFNEYIDEQTLRDIKNRHNTGINIDGKDVKDVRVSSIVKDKKKFYALSNESFENIKMTLNFDEYATEFEVWNPWSGSIDSYALKENKTLFELEANELLFIRVTNKENHEEFQITKTRQTDCEAIVLQTDSKIKDFGSWTSVKGMEEFSGSVLYTIGFQGQEKIYQEESYILDLGDVREFVTLYINGEEIDTLFWAPYEFYVTGDQLLNSTIHLQVTNTLANNYDKISLESGLLDEIRVLEIIS